MKPSLKSLVLRIAVGGIALLGLSLLGVSSSPSISRGAEESSQSATPAPEGKAESKEEKVELNEVKSESKEEECCKAGDTTPPSELVAKTPIGQLHSPYQDYAKLAKEEELTKQFRLPGCNECHGGTGGGGFCPALSQGVWFWGNTDDVLFRLVTLGSAALEKSGFQRYQYGSVHGPMPPMGFSIPTSDQLWKIIAFIRSINPPGANPPEKLIPGRTGPKE